MSDHTTPGLKKPLSNDSLFTSEGKQTPYNGLQVPTPELSMGLLDMLILGLHTRTDALESLSEDQKLMF